MEKRRLTDKIGSTDYIMTHLFPAWMFPQSNSVRR